MLRRVALVAVVVAAGASGEASVSLFKSPGPGDDAMYIAPERFNHSLIGPVGIVTRPEASWYAAQWNNPASLAGATPFRRPTAACPGTALGRPLEWGVSTDSAAVCTYNGTAGRSWRLAQDGASVPCGVEYDLFLSPVGANYPNATTGMRPSPNLTAMSELRVTATLALASGTASERCGTAPQCGPGGKVDYGYAVLGIVCGDTALPGGAGTSAMVPGRGVTRGSARGSALTGTPQTLFYQVLLSDTRQNSSCPGHGGADCSPRPRDWYFKTNPFGANDGVATLGQPCLRPGAGAVAYDFDALPALRAAVAAGPPGGNGFVTDPSRWAVHGVYLGVGLQGSAVMTLDVAGFDVRWRPA